MGDLMKMLWSRRGWNLRHKKGCLRQEHRAHSSSIVTRENAESEGSEFLF